MSSRSFPSLVLSENECTTEGELLACQLGGFAGVLVGLLQVGRGIHSRTLYLLGCSFDLVATVACQLTRGRLEAAFRCLGLGLGFFGHEYQWQGIGRPKAGAVAGQSCGLCWAQSRSH